MWGCQKMKPKKWVAGVADSAWKVMICARDEMEIEKCVSMMIYRLTDSGSDRDAGIAAISQMTGRDIIEALIDQKEKCLKAVENGFRK